MSSGILENLPCYAPALIAVRDALADGPVLVAVDGRCASGKTIFAQQLAKRFPCNVFHMDDFFLPPGLRSAERLNQPGGNIHYERAETELFAPLRRGETVVFARFNCRGGNMESQPAYLFQPLSVVEGSYAHHPILAPYSTLKIFFTVAQDIQLRRLERRAPEKLDTFRRRWIPMEERYFSALDIPNKADIIVDTSEIPFESV